MNGQIGHSPLRLIYMGTPSFAVPGLRALLDAGIPPLLVVTQPDRPKGRGMKPVPPPVKEFSVRKGLQVAQPESPNSQDFVETLRSLSPDLIVVIAYGHILKRDLLKVPRIGCLNIHASLLPQLRGAAPIQWAILNGLRETGLTAIWMDEGMDTGDIIHSQGILIHNNESYGTLEERLGNLSGPFLIKVLREIEAKGYIPGTPQDHQKATYAPKITKDLLWVDWKMTKEHISARIRAFDPYPGAMTTYKGHVLKLYEASHKDLPSKGEPGRVLVSRGPSLVVDTQNGVVTIGALQIPGKRRLPAEEFLRGFKIKEGDFLGE